MTPALLKEISENASKGIKWWANIKQSHLALEMQSWAILS